MVQPKKKNKKPQREKEKDKRTSFKKEKVHGGPSAQQIQEQFKSTVFKITLVLLGTTHSPPLPCLQLALKPIACDLPLLTHAPRRLRPPVKCPPLDAFLGR